MRKILFIGAFLYCYSTSFAQYDLKVIQGRYNYGIFTFYPDQTKVDSALSLSARSGTSYNSGATCLYNIGNNNLYNNNSQLLVCNITDTIENSFPLVDSLYGFSGDGGQGTPGSTLMLPKNDREVYALAVSFTDTAWPNPSVPADRVWLATLDMQANNGKGSVSYKEPILNKYIDNGRLGAVRHGNGKDWWVVVNENRSDYYDVILLNSIGRVDNPILQQIGLPTRFAIAGNIAFSPDGTKMLITDLVQKPQLFDFDRCTGLLSNPQTIDYTWLDKYGQVIPSAKGCLYGVFSPNGRFLYLNNYFSIWQYDLQASNIDSSKVLIALYDSTRYSKTSDAFVFEKGKVENDGKIYYDQYGGGFYPYDAKLCVINNPDQKGSACDFTIDAFNCISYQGIALPDNINYHTTELAGSPCDTIATAIVEALNPAATLYPNPAEDRVQLQSTTIFTAYQLFDISGRLILAAPLDSTQQIAVSSLARGVYWLKLSTNRQNNSTTTLKIIKQ